MVGQMIQNPAAGHYSIML